MKCEKYQGEMEEWLDGALGQNARAELERHLRTCAACAQYLDQRRRLGTALKNTLHELSSGLHYQPPAPSRLRAGKRWPWRPYWLSFNPRAVVALAAVSLVVLLFLFQPWIKPRQKSADGKLTTAVITVSDSLDMADESFITGSSNGYAYRIHLEISLVRVNDHS
jgi:anti-sigma factor RsiW